MRTSTCGQNLSKSWSSVATGSLLRVCVSLHEGSRTGASTGVDARCGCQWFGSEPAFVDLRLCRKGSDEACAMLRLKKLHSLLIW